MIALTTPAWGGYVVPINIGSALADELSDLTGTESLQIDGHSYVLFEESEEINEHKHVLFDRIYRRDDDKYFLQECSKSGAYWCGYEFEYGDTLYEVKKTAVTVYQWKVVK